MNDENFGYQSRSRPVAALARTNATVPGDRERYRFARSPSGEAQRPMYDENFGYQSRSRPVAALARTNTTVPGDRERYSLFVSSNL